MSEFVTPLETTPNRPGKVESVKYVSHEGHIMTRVMVDSYSANPLVRSHCGRVAVDYTLDQNGVRNNNCVIPTTAEMAFLIENFRRDPYTALTAARVNLINIAQDKRVAETERKERLGRYLAMYLQQISTLDAWAFPPDHDPDADPKNLHVYKGVPAYIPDGLSDMGGEGNTDPMARGREKIRADKLAGYQKAFPELFKTIWDLKDSTNPPDSPQTEKYLAQWAMIQAYSSLPYDIDTFLGKSPTPKMPGYSVRMVDKVNSGKAESFCRHIAFETQLRFQAFGLVSRLSKCNMDGVPHGANLVRIGSQWHFADPTNPEWDSTDPTKGQVFLRPIDEKSRSWTFDVVCKTKEGIITTNRRTYSQRFDMNYRIRDNKRDPVA